MDGGTLLHPPSSIIGHALPALPVTRNQSERRSLCSPNILITPSEPCSVPCGGDPSRRSYPWLFLSEGPLSTAAYWELDSSVRPPASRIRVLRGPSPDNVETTSRCHILSPRQPIRPLQSPRVLIHDSSLRTPILPRTRVHCQCCHLLGSEGG